MKHHTLVFNWFWKILPSQDTDSNVFLLLIFHKNCVLKLFTCEARLLKIHRARGFKLKVENTHNPSVMAVNEACLHIHVEFLRIGKYIDVVNKNLKHLNRSVKLYHQVTQLKCFRNAACLRFWNENNCKWLKVKLGQNLLNTLQCLHVIAAHNFVSGGFLEQVIHS